MFASAPKFPPSVSRAKRRALPRLLPPGMRPPRTPNAPPPPIGVCPWGYKLVWGGTQWVCAQLPNAPPPPQFAGSYFGDVVMPALPRIPLGGPMPSGLRYGAPHPGLRQPPFTFVPEDEIDFNPYMPGLTPMPGPAPRLPYVPPGIIPIPPVQMPPPELPPPVSYYPPTGTEVPLPEFLPLPTPCPPACEYDAEELMRAWLCSCPRYCP